LEQLSHQPGQPAEFDVQIMASVAVCDGGHHVPGVAGILGANSDRTNFTFEVRSGHYSFIESYKI